jgi:DNA recombination protein RmuC
MLETLLVVCVLVIGVLVLAYLRQTAAQADLKARFEALEYASSRIESRLGEEFDRSRASDARLATELRSEVGATLQSLGRSIAERLQSNEVRMESLRGGVEGRLRHIQEDNAKRLESIRSTVDEKLHGVLERRLGESFKSVSERLEQVHRGLGQMQELATGVGDLKRVLINVKTRGNWGEVQLGALLEQVLSPEQYERNVQTRPRTQRRVDYAIKLPGRSESDGHVWLPIDAKFPQDDYQRLLEAQEVADVKAVELASKRLEAQIRESAKEISDKYLNPPHTTDFGILFMPTEGLYAEVARRAGLMELLQREYRVVCAGPMTLAALLNSLQLGFRTLAIERRSSEVWTILSHVKEEFGKFGGLLTRVKDKLDQASRTIDVDLGRRQRKIARHLRDVQELPVRNAPPLLFDALDEGGEDDDEGDRDSAP